MLALVDCGSKRIPSIAAFLNEQQVCHARIPLMEANAQDFGSFEAIIISGGPHLFTQPENTLIENFAFIRELELPILGICLGLQAIGLTYGAQIFRGTPRRKEDQIHFHQAHPLLEGLENDGVFAEDHCEGITLPPTFTLLGSSTEYPVEIMACDRRRRYGVQFHPETSGERGQHLLRNFLRLALHPALT